MGVVWRKLIMLKYMKEDFKKQSYTLYLDRRDGRVSIVEDVSILQLISIFYLCLMLGQIWEKSIMES